MRTITGFSMVFLIVFLMYLNPIAFAALFLLIALLGLWEFYSLTTTETISPQQIFGTVAGFMLFIVFSKTFILSDGTSLLIPLFLPMVLLFLSFIIEIFRKQANPFVNIAITFLGVFYIALPLSLLTIMARPEVNRDLFGLPSFLFGFFILTWAYDTGAYLAGKSFGKHKFFERISPKKTWEGIIGGLLVAAGIATLFTILVPAIEWYHWTALMGMVVFFGTMGDLAESMFKRSLSVKDSGNILPGHGGILDRFDSVFLSAPFVFLYFILFLSTIA